jgi:hypothetical protein
MRLFYLDHIHQTARLTLEQRGLLDVVRGELWSVAGVKMLRSDLFTRMQIKPGSKHERLLTALVDLGLLHVDAEEWVTDPVLADEWTYALQRSETNRVNATKPRKKPQDIPVTTTTAPDDHDY